MHTIYDLIIVGGGPAALSAAFYGLAKRINVLLLYEELGGKIGWRQRLSGADEEAQRFDRGRRLFGDALHQEIVDLEADYLPGNEVVRLLIGRTTMQAGHVIHGRALQISRHDSLFSVDTRGHGTLHAAAVLVATGAKPIRLDVPGSQCPVGQGIGYSMTTYAHLVAGKRVAVIGTTRRALRGAAELARTAEHLFLIIPGGLPDHCLAPALVARPNVELLPDFEVKEVIGANRVQGLVLDSRDGQREIAAQCIFVDLGLVPNSDMVRGLAATTPEGFIVVDRRHATDVPGLFAAGDVTDAFGEQVLIAVGDGTRAAMSAYDYLLESWLTEAVPDPDPRAELAADPYPSLVSV